MTDTTREAVERLARKLRTGWPIGPGDRIACDIMGEATDLIEKSQARIAVLEAEVVRLSQPAPVEPVAWRITDDIQHEVEFTPRREKAYLCGTIPGFVVEPLYTHPPRAAQTPPEDVGAVAQAAEILRLDQRAMTELVMHQFRHRAHATAGEIDRRRKKMDACLAALAKQGGAENG